MPEQTVDSFEQIRGQITQLAPARGVSAYAKIKVCILTQPVTTGLYGSSNMSLAQWSATYFSTEPRPTDEFIRINYEDAKKIDAGLTSGKGYFTAADASIIKEQVVGLWSKVTNLNFEFVDDPAQADIRIGIIENGISQNYQPGDQNGVIKKPGDVFLNSYNAGMGMNGRNINDLAHEFGHALGLSHPARDSGLLSAQYDTLQWSLMSYNNAKTGPVQAITPLLLDAVGLQALGLLRNDLNQGDTEFILDRVNSSKLIIDSGGKNTLSAKYVGFDGKVVVSDLNAVIDLRASNFSTGKAYFSSIPTVGSHTNNVAIYQGTVIQNAIGGNGNDRIVGNDVDNRIDGGKGDDTLEGGLGNDTYVFDNSWGKDVVLDTDGLGVLQINGAALSGLAKGAGVSGSRTWSLSATSGQAYTLELVNSGGSQRLVISKSGDKSKANSITINDFDVAKAQSASGYLGIRLDGPRITVSEDVGTNPWVDPSYIPTGGSTTLAEGGARMYIVYLDQAARAGDKLVLALSGEATLFTATLGDDTLPANGAVITLVAGQTQASFMLHQVGDVEADVSAQLTVTYQGKDYSGEPQSVMSDPWAITVQDAGQDARTYMGDQRALIRGVEVDLGIAPGDPRYNTYKWETTGWLADGTLAGGTAEEDFNDVIHAGGGNDKVLGLGGNDALDGGAGNDSIEGGDGDDLLAGGAGSDSIKGGAGNDVILGATGLTVPQRVSVDDSWIPPGGEPVWISGSNWGVHINPDGTFTVNGGGSLQMDDNGDVLEGGSGDDRVVGGLGKDYLDGGDDNDTLWGGGGADVLIGGAGDDVLRGDGTIEPGYFQTVDPSANGDDFLDGGVGNDTLVGGGGSDVLFGGIGNDVLVGDEENKDKLAGTFHGQDYLDGEDGNDELLGGGDDDTLYGGSGDDRLWGDSDTQQKLQAEYHGSDYLDGEDGNDTLYGGGKDDTLLGGIGDDWLFGDAEIQYLEGQYHGSDYLDGGKGNDTLFGGGKNDTLIGGEGDDVLLGDGNFQAAIAAEDEGDDYLDGGSGNDTLVGGGGNDTLVGGSGTDQLQGGAGDDTYIFRSGDSTGSGGGLETIIDSQGSNTAVFSDVDSSEVQVSRSEGGDLMLSFGQNSVVIQGGLSGAVGNFVFSDTTWSLQDIKTRMFGATEEDDNIIGTPQDDWMSSGGGSDILTGGDGNDTLIGGTGDDLLRGGEGNNRYVFARGDGQDTIGAYASAAPNKNNVLQFTDVLPGDVQARRVNDDLVLSIAGGSDQITVQLFFWGDSPGTREYNSLQQVEFADGTSWGLPQIVAKVMGGTGGNDSIRGTWNNDLITGQAGDDTLYGASGDDTLDGGAGNDSIYLDGNDVLQFGRGDGHDIINFGVVRIPGTVATLQFKQGVAPEDVVVRRAVTEFGVSPDLEVSIVGTDDKVRIEYFLLSEMGGGFTPMVQQFTFADGTVWDLATILDKALSGTSGDDTIHGIELDRLFQGLAGNDKIYGGKGNDTLEGGEGNDTLNGESGNDVYLFGRGDGQDYLGWNSNTTPSTVDTLQFKDGVSPGDVEVRRANDDLLLKIAGSNDQVRVGAYFYSDDPGNAYNPVQQVRFANGTVWDLQTLTTKALTGIADGEIISGTIGADTITGQGGDDWLYGNTGADTYVFGLGDGVDRIYDSAEPAGGASNRIVFKQGVLAGSLAASLDGNNLVLHYGNQGDMVIIGGYDGSKPASERVVDRVDFADGSSASLAVVLSSPKPNHAPTVGDPLLNQEAAQGTVWNFTIPVGAFADMDADDVLQFSATLANGAALPSWLSFDASTGTFTGTAGYEDIGGLDVLVTATDQGGLSAEQQFQLTVAESSNHQPQFGVALYNQITTEGALWTYMVPVDAFTDADPGDELQYSVVLGDGSPLPDWISFDSATRTLSGIAGHENVGNLEFRVIATDQGGLSAEQHFELTVAAAGNHQPHLGTQLSDQNVTQGMTWTFVIPFSAFVDVDPGDELQYSVLLGDGSPLPDWMSFDPATRTLSGMPSNADVGALVIHVVATDNGGLSAGQYFGLEVRSGATGGGDIPETTSAGVDVTWDGWSRTSMGSAGDDVIVGGAGADWMFGGAGNDTLRSAEDPESLSSYYDYMEGNSGNDVYYVDLASPTTTINQTGALATDMDVVRFGPGITPENLHIQQVNGSYLNISQGSQLLAQLVGWWDTDVRRIDRLEFADGTIIQGSQLDNMIESGLYTAEGYDGPIVGRGEATASFYGNEDDNVMIGGVGNDTFDPWMGNDTMAGGLGSDSYYFYRSTGADVIEEDDQPGSGSSDAVVILGDVSADQLWFSQDSNDLEVRIIGTDDRLRIKDWFSDQTHRVEEFRLESGTVLLDGQVQNLVQAMAAFSVPAAGQTTLPANYQSNLAPVIAASWQ